MAQFDEPTAAPEFSNFEPEIRVSGSLSQSGTNNLSASTSSSTPSIHERRSASSRASRLSLMAPLDENALFGGNDESENSYQNEVHAHFPPFVETEYGQQLPIEAKSGPARITVLSYNVLASRYAHTDKYPCCPRPALLENYRVNNLVAQVRECNADIMAFQELPVGLVLPDGEWSTALENMGYCFYHVPITSRQTGSNSDPPSTQPSSLPSPAHPRSVGGVFSAAATPATSFDVSGSNNSLPRSSQQQQQQAPPKGLAPPSFNASPASSGGNAPGMNKRLEHEGVGIYWRSTRFERLEEIPIEFNTRAANDRKLRPQDRTKLCIASHNVAALVVLKDKMTGDNVIVASIHGYFERSRPECQAWQLVQLLQTIEEIKGLYYMQDPSVRTAVVLLGDFNAEPWKPAIRYVVEGAMPCLDAFAYPIGNIEAANHSLGLVSAYPDSYFSANPNHVTAMMDTYEGVIDHIFVSEDSYVPAAVAKLDVKKSIPDKSHPSDHYPVATVLIPRPPE